MPLNISGSIVSPLEVREYEYNSIIQSGLVLHLDARIFNTVSGTTWFDLSGKGYHGTLTNGPTFNSTNQGGIVFDGTNDYVNLVYSIITGTGNFTINQWVQSTSDNIGGCTFGNYNAGNLEIFFGTNYIGMWLNNNSTYLGTSPYSVTLPEFTTSPVMITAGRSGTTTFFYINGILKKQGSSSAVIGTGNFRIGTNTTTTEQFKGTVYTTQIYNRALTQEEITHNYNLTKYRYGL